MTVRHAETTKGHPNDHHPGYRIGWLIGAIAAAPGAWFVHLVAGYGLANVGCDESASSPSRQLVISLVYLVCLAACAACGWIGVDHLRRAVAGGDERHHVLVELGENLPAFLAIWAVLFSATFVIPIVIDLIGLFSVPPCAP